MVRPLIAVLMACAVTLAVEAQSKPPAHRSHLDGNWQLEEPIVPENAKNWQRTRSPNLTAGATGGRGGASGLNIPPCIEMPPGQEVDGTRAASQPCPQPSASVMHALALTGILQRVGKTLIAESFKLSIIAGPKAIAIGDDFFNPTSFTLSWRGHRLAVPSSRSVQPSHLHYTTVVVKTRWQDDALVQDLSGTDGGGFRIRRIFKLAEDGQRLLMLIQVVKPKLTPPVADITRAYLRDRK